MYTTDPSVWSALCLPVKKAFSLSLLSALRGAESFHLHTPHTPLPAEPVRARSLRSFPSVSRAFPEPRRAPSLAGPIALDFIRPARGRAVRARDPAMDFSHVFTLGSRTLVTWISSRELRPLSVELWGSDINGRPSGSGQWSVPRLSLFTYCN